MIDFIKLIQAEIDRRGWTPYRLHRECGERVTQPTVYNLLDGKSVKSETLAIVFDVLGFRVITPEKMKWYRQMQASIPKPKPIPAKPARRRKEAR